MVFVLVSIDKVSTLSNKRHKSAPNQQFPKTYKFPKHEWVTITPLLGAARETKNLIQPFDVLNFLEKQTLKKIKGYPN